jgi:adenylosuccinate lyase
VIKRYTPKYMQNIWHEEAKYYLWADIELTVLRILGRHGVIKITDKIPHIALFHMPSIVAEAIEEELTTKHDVVAFLNVFEKALQRCIGHDSRFIHYGMTSSDLVDTALALQIKRSLDETKKALISLTGQLDKLCIDHKDSVMMGRTHGMQAEPLTFGRVLYVYNQEFWRHQDRLDELQPRVTVGKLSGAVGTYAHLPPYVERDVMMELGIKAEEGPNQIVQRDRHAELLNWIALVGCSLEKLATQIRHLSRSEVCEVSEGHGKGYKGSSAMPHKRNPINSENICGLSRLLRGYAVAGMEDVALWHERDISHSSVERVAIPDAFCLLYFMLDRMKSTLENLVVNTTLMKERVVKCNGQANHEWMSQAVMLRLIEEGMPRKEAHDLVQESLDNAVGKLKNNGDLGIDRHLKYITQQDADISTADDT